MRLTWWGFLLLVIVALILSARLKLDHDTGPAAGESYPWWDRWSKWHLIGSLLIAAAAVALGVPLIPGVAITIAAGWGWERVNGYVSGGDILWDTLGAIAGGMLAHLWRLHALAR